MFWLRLLLLGLSASLALRAAEGTAPVEGTTLAKGTAPAELAEAKRLYGRQRYAEARKVFSRLAEARPDDPELNYYLGRLALWFDEPDTGIACLEKAERRAPGEARIQNALGDAYGLNAQKSGLLAKYGWALKCREAYERAVQLNPGNIDYHWSLFTYYRLAPRIAGGGAERAHEQAIQIGRLDAMAGLIAQATLLLAQGGGDEAFGLFERIARREPANFLAHYQMGRCAAVVGGHLDAGIAALRACLLLHPPAGSNQPTYANVHYRLSILLKKKGEETAAAAEYAQALRLSPDFRPDKQVGQN